MKRRTPSAEPFRPAHRSRCNPKTQSRFHRRSPDRSSGHPQLEVHTVPLSGIDGEPLRFLPVCSGGLDARTASSACGRRDRRRGPRCRRVPVGRIGSDQGCRGAGARPPPVGHRDGHRAVGRSASNRVGRQWEMSAVEGLDCAVDGQGAADTAALCQRCGKRIDIGDDIRYHNDFVDPVHVGCREPSARTESGPTKPKPPPLKEIPVCPSCWTQHAGQCW